MSNACAPIPLQWKAGPIFALHSVIRSVKLAKIYEASSSVENDLLILDVLTFHFDHGRGVEARIIHVARAKVLEHIYPTDHFLHYY